MGRLHGQCGWLSAVLASAVMVLLPAVAGADPLHADDEASLVVDDEADNEFAWATDQESEFLVSFDPEEEEAFLTWQVDF